MHKTGYLDEDDQCGEFDKSRCVSEGTGEEQQHRLSSINDELVRVCWTSYDNDLRDATQEKKRGWHSLMNPSHDELHTE